MPVVASELVQQYEILARVKRLRELFANDPEVARIDYRFAGDWSGDDSLFINVVLHRKRPMPQQSRASRHRSTQRCPQ